MAVLSMLSSACGGLSSAGCTAVIHDPCYYWVDTDTQLKWAAVRGNIADRPWVRDNGIGVNWYQAACFCRSLVVEDVKDWTLPTVDQLEAIARSSRGYNNTHWTGMYIKGNIALSTGLIWSATPTPDASGHTIITSH
jgi:hypothetical protein